MNALRRFHRPAALVLLASAFGLAVVVLIAPVRTASVFCLVVIGVAGAQLAVCAARSRRRVRPNLDCAALMTTVAASAIACSIVFPSWIFVPVGLLVVSLALAIAVLFVSADATAQTTRTRLRR